MSRASGGVRVLVEGAGEVAGRGTKRTRSELRLRRDAGLCRSSWNAHCYRRLRSPVAQRFVFEVIQSLGKILGGLMGVGWCLAFGVIASARAAVMVCCIPGIFFSEFDS